MFPAYFDHGTVAERYARYRPDVHPAFAARIAAVTGPRRLAVDVGAGTGQSARAVAVLAARVVAVEPSTEMLAAAAPHPSVDWVRGRAEALPVASASADLVVTALAFHWFDAAAFLAEAGRVLDGGGWLTIYAGWFLAEMEGDPGFQGWFRSEHLARFPTPPRSRTRVDAGLAAEHGYEWGGQEELRVDVPMRHEALVGYLLTQSNVIAAVEEGSMGLAAAAEVVRAATAPFFGGRPEARFGFGGRLAYLRPARMQAE